MTIKAKQATLLAGFILSLVFLVAFSLIKLADIKERFANYHEIGVQMETSVLRIGKEVNYVSRLTRSIMLGDKYDKNMSALDESSRAIDGFFAQAMEAADKIADQEQRDAFGKRIETSHSDTRAFVDDGIARMRAIADMAAEHRASAWSGYHAQATPLANKARESFKQLTDMSSAYMKDSKSRAEAAIDTVFVWLPVVALLAMALMVFLSYTISSDLLRRLGGEPADAALAVKKIARGDLTSEIPVAPGDEDSLLAAVRTMQSDLRTTIAHVGSSASELHEVSDRVTTIIEGLGTSSSAQRQAAAEMASSMGLVAQNVRQVTSNSNDSWSVARDAGNLSASGGQIVLETHAEMNKIAEAVARSSSSISELGTHSEKISAVANAIREIADQTNLLALNAAIEAARAGEQGRGFAVVADEVRKLAERTTKATQEIGTIIGSIITGTDNAVASMTEVTSFVERGVDMIDRAGESMRRISEGSNRVIHAVGEINSALASQEEATGTVSSRVDSITRMAEENHDSVQQIAQATRQLKALADALNTSMNQFKT